MFPSVKHNLDSYTKILTWKHNRLNWLAAIEGLTS